MSNKEKLIAKSEELRFNKINFPANFDFEIEKVNKEDCYFFKIDELVYEEEYPKREALENVFCGLANTGFKVVYLLLGNGRTINIYFGIIKSDLNEELSAGEYASGVLKPVFEGNFQGSKIEDINNIEKDIFKPFKKAQHLSVVNGIPSISEENIEFQGIDRLINSMYGETFQLMLVSEAVRKEEIEKRTKEIYQLYNYLHTESKIGIQSGFSKTNTENESNTTNDSQTKSKKKTTETFGKAETKGQSHSYAQNKSGNIEFINKESLELLKYIDEELIGRMQLGKTKGLFKSSIYISARDKSCLQRLEKNIQSLFQSNHSQLAPLNIHKLELENPKDFLLGFKNYELQLDFSQELALLNSIPFSKNKLTLGSYLTPKELSLIAGLPQKEVAGVSLKEATQYGINIPKVEKENRLKLGQILQRGKKLKLNLALDKRNLNKHIFISGVTGSGKTTTCKKILKEANLPFLVIEPAKTEYRNLLKDDDEIYVFTLGNENITPFRFNPFEFLESESISSHVDMLRASFEAAFDMEAAIPQVLEKALYRVYENYGWDIDDDSNLFLEDRSQAFDGSGLYFPTLEDLVDVIDEVVEEHGFDQRLKNDYIGSVKARLDGLLVGAKGQMLNCKKSLDFSDLLHKKVVIELEEIKSTATKSLIMGLLLTKLAQTLKEEHSKNNKFQHITLVEEAHRLLSKVKVGDSGNKKQAVAMFTDMLAEVRKYGESLIIADQIPNKLTPEVIKNTNTKIIHKLFARDDKEIMGDSIALSPKQKDYLGHLETGETVIFSQGWGKAVHTKIKRPRLNDDDLNDKDLKKLKTKLLSEYQNFYYPDLNLLDEDLSPAELKVYKKNLKKYKLIKRYLKKGEKNKFKKELVELDEKKLKYISNKLCLTTNFLVKQIQDCNNSKELYDSIKRGYQLLVKFKKGKISNFDKIKNIFLERG